MIRHCRHCGRDRETYEDVISNQRAERCVVCHRRIVDGALIDREERCFLLTSKELCGQGRGGFDDSAEPMFTGLRNFETADS